MKKKIFLYFFIIFQLCTKQLFGLENKIIFKINDKFITTFDVIQEERYLKILNPNLNKIDKNKLKVLVIDSIIKEKIKEIELNKYYQIEKALDETNLKIIIKNLYQAVGYQKEKEFKDYLKTQNIKFLSVKRKLAIEMLWNNLIFQKFSNRVVINENEIKNSIDKEINSMKPTRDIFLSEILIKNSKDLKLDIVYSEILKSSENVGFATTANIFSSSDTAKIGGKIGWLKETSLSKEIQKNIINLKKGQISKPIKINENFIILKIDDVKINKQKIDKKKILSNRISYIKNQQLESYSLAYFGKVKQSILINEL
jgi:peptidyl-prolyl cis-trans isomerase SurA